jgi:hypothetical protein
MLPKRTILKAKTEMKEAPKFYDDRRESIHVWRSLLT